MGCQLRITDITRTRSPNGTLDLISGFIEKAIIFIRTARPVVAVMAVDRHFFLQSLQIPNLMFNSDLLEEVEGFLTMIRTFEHEHDASGFHVFRHSTLVFHFQVLIPVVPVEESFVSHCHPIPGGIMCPDDRAGIARRAVS